MEKKELKIEVFTRKGHDLVNKYFPQGGYKDGMRCNTIIISTPLVGHTHFVSYYPGEDIFSISINSTTPSMFLTNKSVALSYLEHWRKVGFIGVVEIETPEDSSPFPEELFNFCFKVNKGESFFSGIL